jgi:prepilin-type N-terminal cleavage/methylation domain-containing protein
MIRRPAVRPAHKSRRGFTLIEALVVITVVGSLLGICAVLIQLLWRLNADAQVRANAMTTLERLGRQLRQDAHRSATVTLEGKAAARSRRLLLLPSPRRTIAYEKGRAEVLRTESEGATIVRREGYVLPEGGDARFELRTEGPRRLVVIVVSQKGSPKALEPAPPMEVLAVLGTERPHRAENSEGRTR